MKDVLEYEVVARGNLGHYKRLVAFFTRWRTLEDQPYLDPVENSSGDHTVQQTELLRNDMSVWSTLFLGTVQLVQKMMKLTSL